MVWMLSYERDKAQNERQLIFNSLKKTIPERLNSGGNTENLHWYDWVRTGEQVFILIRRYRELE